MRSSDGSSGAIYHGGGAEGDTSDQSKWSLHLVNVRVDVVMSAGLVYIQAEAGGAVLGDGVGSELTRDNNPATLLRALPRYAIRGGCSSTLLEALYLEVERVMPSERADWLRGCGFNAIKAQYLSALRWLVFSCDGVAASDQKRLLVSQLWFTRMEGYEEGVAEGPGT